MERSLGPLAAFSRIRSVGRERPGGGGAGWAGREGGRMAASRRGALPLACVRGSCVLHVSAEELGNAGTWSQQEPC